MKKYEKVQLIAKNQIAGSYAAGCPSKDEQCWSVYGLSGSCKKCERSK